MTTLRVSNTLDDLASDCRKVATSGRAEMAKTVRKNARDGNRLSKGFAKSSAGAHGKRYPNAFTAEALSPLSWEYGPDASRPQGGMSFEFGSRNQPPHLDLAKSADIVGPSLAHDAGKALSDLFWPS